MLMLPLRWSVGLLKESKSQPCPLADSPILSSFQSSYVTLSSVGVSMILPAGRASFRPRLQRRAGSADHGDEPAAAA